MGQFNNRFLNKKSNKVLIVGCSGLLGSNLCLEFKDKFEVLGTYNNNNIDLANINKTKLDLLSYKNLLQLINYYKPKFIINCSGYTDVEKCETNPLLAKKINYEIVKNLVKVSKDNKIKLIHISTDHIFDGKKNIYTEKSLTSPVNVYSKTKLLAENYIKKNIKNFIILRSNFFGWGNFNKRSFSDYIYDNLILQKKISLSDKIFFNPVLISTLAKIIMDLIRYNYKGIINVGCKERLSKFDFALKLAKKFDLEASNIIKSNKEKTKVKKPSSMYLSTSKLKKVLNIEIKLSDDFDRLKKMKENGYIKNLRQPIPYGMHYLTKENISDVLKTLNGPYLTQGPNIENFEKNFSKYVGSKYAVAISSCSAGLHLACAALKIKKGDNVITTPITFVSTANAVLHQKANVLFSDIDIDSINLSPKNIAKYNNKKIKLIMPVHFGGVPCDMKKIKEFAKKNNSYIVEDAAHALGSKYLDGSLVGNCKYSDMTVFSFHPVKAIAAGEGGIVTTNSEKIYRSLLRLRSHGINKLNDSFANSKQSMTNNITNPWYYEMQDLGFNYRITDIQASLANSQMKHLNLFLNKRKSIAGHYDKFFRNFKTVEPMQKKFRKYSSFHLYILKINFTKLGFSRAFLMNYLRHKGIITQVHYIPIIFHPYYSSIKINNKDVVNSIKYYSECLSIPIFYGLNKDKLNYITKTLSEILY